MGARRLLKWLGVSLLCAGWGVLLFGLFGLPAAEDPELDLEAGPSFAVNLEIYLPAMLLTVVLLVAVLAVLKDKAGTVVGIGAPLLAGAFAAWVLQAEPLLDYLPNLRSAVLLSGSLSVTSLLVLLGRNAVVGEPPRRAPGTARPMQPDR